MTYSLGMVTTGKTGLAALVAKAGANYCVININQPQHVANDLTVPANVRLNILPGATIQPANGKTVTIHGGVEAGTYQWIDLSAGGTVSFANNAVQETFTAEWWINNDYGSGADCSARLNAMVAAVPDYVTILFRAKGVTLTLAQTWLINSKTGVKIKSPRHVEELPQITLQSSGLPQDVTINRVMTVWLKGCGHCEFSGFWINCTEPISDTSGISLTFGGVRINTNNTIAHNRIVNTGSNAAWRGVDISPDSGQNSEAMQIIGNWLDGNGIASAGLGTGIWLGGNSNNHMHFLFRNLTTGCRYGVDGTWWGAHALHHISESDQTVFNIQHLSYPALIEFTDVESSQTILDTTNCGGESAIVLRNGRFASCGANGVGWFEFGQYTPTTLIEGNDFQNYNANDSILYHLPWIGGGNPGQCIKLQSNFYGNLIGQAFPFANFIVRTGATTGGTILQIDSSSEAFTSGFQETYEIGPAVLNIVANEITVNGTPVVYVNTGTLDTITLTTPMNYGPAMAPTRVHSIFIKAVGGDITVGATDNILTAGTITQNHIQQFMYDPAAMKWLWVN